MKDVEYSINHEVRMKTYVDATYSTKKDNIYETGASPCSGRKENNSKTSSSWLQAKREQICDDIKAFVCWYDTTLIIAKGMPDINLKAW